MKNLSEHTSRPALAMNFPELDWPESCCIGNTKLSRRFSGSARELIRGSLSLRRGVRCPRFSGFGRKGHAKAWTPNRLVLILALGVILTGGCVAGKNRPTTIEKSGGCFQNWPANACPNVVGEKVARNFLLRNYQTNKAGYVVYPEACTAFGALRFARAAGDRDLLRQLVERYAFFLTPEGQRLVSTNRHVDFSVLGIVPLEIYLDTGDEHYLQPGLGLADRQWADPLPDGLTRETRWWVDDAFMVGSLQIQAGRATKDPKYADRAARQLAAYLDKLQKPNGLFYHGPEIPYYWGRGNGWFAVALAEVLRSLPPDHPKYARLMAGYRQMMAGLCRYQTPSGLWRQLIDDDQSWVETSSTGMFTYAMIVGVQQGWLEAGEYGACARRGWMGLCDYLEPDGNLREICVGTSQKPDRQFYLDRPRAVGDLHGQAPVLWCAAALVRK
jgi:unsaturated rhamnogalacturonyl hydrolase